MQTDPKGVSSARQSKLEKDDKYTPVHKTPAFQETVKKVKQGIPVAPVTTTPQRDDFALRHPDFKIPLPAAITDKKMHYSPGSSSTVVTSTDKKLYEQITKDVTAQSGIAATSDQINKEVEKRYQAIKKPRYVFMSDGTPFYFDKKDERADLEASLVGKNWLERNWTLMRYETANKVTGLLTAVGLPSIRTTEYFTDMENQSNVAGAAAQSLLNLGLLGAKYLQYADTNILATEERAKQIEREAEALKFTNPAAAEVRMKTAQDMHKAAILRKKYDDEIQMAKDALMKSWELMGTEWEEAKAIDKEARAVLGQGATPDEIMKFERERRMKLQGIAQESAADFRTKALQAYTAGDFDAALALTMQAQEQDRNSRFGDPQGAYTWIRQPENHENFKKDIAVLELQKGAPLTDSEIRRAKEYHVNAWTEMTGEMFADPLNLIPGAVLTKLIKVPAKGLGLVAKVAGKIPGVTKTVDVLGTPIRALMRESVSSGGNRIARQTYNVMERITNAYTTTEEVTKAIDDISNVVMDAQRATNEQQARQVFEAGRQRVPGLIQITFGDFKGLVDSAAHVDPTQWGKMYSDAITLADQNLSEAADVARKAGRTNADDIVSFRSTSRWGLEKYSEQFSKAFTDPHRIYKNSRLLDDTIAGQITKTLRNLTGDEINEALKVTKFDEWVIEKGAKMGTRVKDVTKAANHWLEASLNLAANMRDIWVMTVLSTFRWPINNLADTSMRSVVYGGNLWDDMVTLFTSAQRTLADELGFSPLEFNQALSRQDLKFTETVPHRLLYEGWKPKAGIFSYYGYEYKRLLAEGGDAAINKADILSRTVDKMPDGILKQNMAHVLDGWNYRVNFLTAARAVPGAISDMNTAIEFTFRLRMFHQEYFKLLKQIEPRFMEQGMEALSPQTRAIAKQIWKAAEGNPRKMTAYVDNLLGGAKNTPAKWSFVVPPELDDILQGMSATDQHLFMGAVKNELDEFIETSARNGKEITPDDFKKFFDDYKVKMQDEIQERLAAAHDYEGLDTGIRTDGRSNDILTEDEIQGSAPRQQTESPRNKKIEDAVAALNRKGKKRPTVDINKDLETAVSDYAKVERVSGDGVRVIKKDGKLIVQVGDNALKQTAGKFYTNINKAVIDILKNQDADVIRVAFSSVDEYDSMMRRFLANPTDVLAENETQFLVLANQFENHPALRQIISQTSPSTIQSYDRALDLYRDLGEYSDVYGFNRRPDNIFQSEAEAKRPLPGSHIAAQNKSSVLTARLAEAGKVSPEINDKVRQFLDNLLVYRQELKQFYAFTYPGPLMNATTGSGRHAGWDMFYRLSEAEFNKEADIKAKLIDLIANDPDGAAKFIDEANNEFATWFLKQNGVDLEWDADKQLILNMKVQGLDGKARNFTARRDIANLQIRFFSPQAKKFLATNPILPIRAGDPIPLRQQLRNALRDTFQLDTAHSDAWARVIDNHAQKWAQETGQPIEKYYERLGFQKVDSSSAKGLGTLEQTRIVKRGAVQRTDDGGFRFYGLSSSNFEAMVRETGELFFDDLVSMAEHNGDAATDLKNIKKFLEEQTGKPVRGNKLQQAHSDILADVFSSYVATGHGPNIAVKGGFDRMKAWMVQTFDAVKDTKIAGEIGDDVYRVLDRMFIETKMEAVPKTNARTIKQMAKDADLVARDEDDLLKIINDALRPADAPAPGTTPIKWTSERGVGSTPIQSAASKKSFVVKMSADEFLSLNPERKSDVSLDYLREQATKGEPIGRPFLDVRWKGDHWEVFAHEGRGRAMIAKELGQDVEVNIIPKGGMEKLTPEMRAAIITADPEGYRVATTTLTKDAKDLVDKADAAEEVIPMSDDIKKIAKENAIFVDEDTTVDDIVAELRQHAKDTSEYASVTPRAFMSPDQESEYSQLVADYQKLINKPEGGSDWVLRKREMEDKMAAFEAKVRNPPAQTYATLGDVPKDVAAKILGTQESVAAKQIQEGWEVWRTQRGLVGFPKDALADPDTFKAYLKTRMSEEWSEAGSFYNRLMWEVEQFEDAMLNYHTGDELATTIFPRVHEAQISNGMKTFIRNQEQMVNNYEQARRALDAWGEYMAKLSGEGHPAALLSKEDQALLKNWAYNDGSKAKVEMVDRLLHGNADEGIEGAIDRVNRVMLDYQHTNVTDQFMKNWFPFWMFPSRSFPFWAETLATHPKIIAGYEKLQRVSRSQRYQTGAVTSTGKPMPSLDGYILIPGTDMWFNPLAPFSFRYLLDIHKSKDNILYAAQSDEDVSPGTFVASELMQMGQMYGFSLGPWAAWSIKRLFNIPDEILPRYPIIPYIQLVPRWMVAEHIQRLDQMNLFGIPGLGSQIYPEVPWHDSLVEKRLLENALQQIQSGKLSEDAKIRLMHQTQSAIKYKGNNPLWQQTYKELSNEEWAQSTGSFFTGIYTKEFGDAQADLLALRNEVNLLKSSMNNEFQADLFDLPTDADAAWENYLKKNNTPEGWVHRLYTDTGWVRNDMGELVRDPKERAYWLSEKITQDERQQIYYAKSASIQKEYEKRLAALPIGASWEQRKIIYDWYSEERALLEPYRGYERRYGSSKPVSLIQEDIAKDWYRHVIGSKPRWNVEKGETYTDYQQRVMEWENDLPKIAAIQMRAYMRSTLVVKTFGALHEDQQFNTNEFMAGLLANTNKEGLDAWQRENDDIFDALNKGWQNLYWDEYWNSVIGKDGYDVDIAEENFYKKHPEPPSSDELYKWIVITYGPDKFTKAEVDKYVIGTDELDIEQRRLQGQADPVDYKMRQETWDMLSWKGPGNNEDFNIAFLNAGGDPDMMTTWYEEGGKAFQTQPDKLKQFHDAIMEANKAMQLTPPKGAELRRMDRAQDENTEFQQAVTEEFGKEFLDYKDADGLTQQGTYSYYNDLSYEAKKDFRENFPDDYEDIQNYKLMRQAFGETHSAWGDYYLTKEEQESILPKTTSGGSVLVTPTMRASRNYKKNTGAGSDKPQYTPRQQTSYVKQDYPSFNIYDRTSNYISPGLYQLVGNKLAYEITNLYSNNRKISAPGVTFLRSLSSRYPQYSTEINRILGRGT